MLKHPVAVSRNGKDIYAYLTRQPVAANIARDPHLVTLIKEIAGKYDLSAASEYIEHDIGRKIGYADRLKVGDEDVIFYARMSKTGPYTKFVKNLKTPATSFLTFTLDRDKSGNYELTDVWLGKNYPPMPGDEAETNASKSYWQEHAVVYNGQHIIATTITKDCPY